MKSLKKLKLKSKTLLIIGSVLSLSAFAQEQNTPNDPFSVVGGFSTVPGGIKIPSFSDAQVKAQVQDLLKTKPTATNLNYDGLFDPQDQKAFDELLAQITIRIHESSKDLYKIKNLFIEGSVVFDHYLKSASSDSKAGKRQLQSVAEMYRKSMQASYDDVLYQFAPLQKLTSTAYAYQVDSNGNVSALALFDVHKDSLKVIESIFGSVDLTQCHVEDFKISGCGEWRFTHGSIADVATSCRTSVCVGEIGKIAEEMLSDSLGLNEKIKFKDSQVNQFSLFFDPKHSAIRSALSNYIDQISVNQETNAPLIAALGLSNIAYVPSMALLDGIIDLRVVRTTFDFKPTCWEEYDGKCLDNHFLSGKDAPKELGETFVQVGAAKLRAAAEAN